MAPFHRAERINVIGQKCGYGSILQENAPEAKQPAIRATPLKPPFQGWLKLRASWWIQYRSGMMLFVSIEI
jgi:hypothetical protein